MILSVFTHWLVDMCARIRKQQQHDGKTCRQWLQSHFTLFLTLGFTSALCMLAGWRYNNSTGRRGSQTDHCLPLTTEPYAGRWAVHDCSGTANTPTPLKSHCGINKTDNLTQLPGSGCICSTPVSSNIKPGSVSAAVNRIWALISGAVSVIA